MHRLLDALKRIMEPPARKKRPLIQRSAPVVVKVKPPPVAARPTDEEAQYLTYFTDYCKRDDFVAYRSEFPDDFDLTFQSRRVDTEIETIIGKSISEEPALLPFIGEEPDSGEREEDNHSIVIENVTESADLLENNSCVYIPKDRISLTRYDASSVT